MARVTLILCFMVLTRARCWIRFWDKVIFILFSWYLGWLGLGELLRVFVASLLFMIFPGAVLIKLIFLIAMNVARFAEIMLLIKSLLTESAKFLSKLGFNYFWRIWVSVGFFIQINFIWFVSCHFHCFFLVLWISRSLLTWCPNVPGLSFVTSKLYSSNTDHIANFAFIFTIQIPRIFIILLQFDGSPSSIFGLGDSQVFFKLFIRSS